MDGGQVMVQKTVMRSSPAMGVCWRLCMQVVHSVFPRLSSPVATTVKHLRQVKFMEWVLTLAQGFRGLSLHLHDPLTLGPGVVQGFVTGTMVDKYAPWGGWKKKEEDARSQYCFQEHASNNLTKVPPSRNGRTRSWPSIWWRILGHKHNSRWRLCWVSLRKCTTVDMNSQTSAVALWDGIILSFLAGRPCLVFLLIGSWVSKFPSVTKQDYLDLKLWNISVV